MAKEKDLSEKMLEQYNDVFADIVNGIIFQGEQVVDQNDLQDTALEAAYRPMRCTTSSGNWQGQSITLKRRYLPTGAARLRYRIGTQNARTVLSVKTT